MQDRSNWLNVLEQAIPEDVTVNVLSFEKQTCLIEGESSSSEAIQEFQYRLQDSGVFSDMSLDYVNQKMNGDNRAVYMFRLQGQGNASLKMIEEHYDENT